jgi:outer membrane protein TolC
MKKYCYLILLILPVIPTQGQAFAERLSLQAAIEFGLTNNPAIKSSAQKIKAARGGIWSGIAPGPLEISIANDYIPANQKLNRFGEQSIGISQSLDFPARYLLQGSKLLKEKEIAQQEFMLAQIAIVAKIKSAYFNVLAWQQQVQIAQEGLVIADDFVKKSEIRHSVGEGTNLERLTAKVQYNEAVNTLAANRNHLMSAFGELNFSLGYGKNESKEFQLTDSLGLAPCDFTLAGLTQEAAALNPLLKTGTLRVRALAIDRSLAWSSILPGFNFEYFKQQVRGDPAGYYGVSLGISVPLWCMFEQQGNIRQASANLESAAFDLLATENAVYLKTLYAYNQFKNEEKQVTFYRQEILPQAEEIFRTASKSYEAGEINYIEFLQAQQTLITSRSNYLQALLSYNLSIVAIEEAIGTTLPLKGDQK